MLTTVARGDPEPGRSVTTQDIIKESHVTRRASITCWHSLSNLSI